MDILKQLIDQIKDTRAYGFDYPNAEMAINDVIDECREVREDIQANAVPNKIQEEIGDVIYAAVFLCDLCGFDVEETVKKTTGKFIGRMDSMKSMATELGIKNLQGQSRAFMLDLWSKAKMIEKNLVT